MSYRTGLNDGLVVAFRPNLVGASDPPKTPMSLGLVAAIGIGVLVTLKYGGPLVRRLESKANSR